MKPENKQLPRVLCLHGGGVNAAIFQAQARCFIPHLQHSFRLVWAEAPYTCDPHPDVITVYGSYGPFRRWIRYAPGHANIDSDSCISDIGLALRTAMENDNRKGAMGEWVGLIGFSQGAKIAASLLLEQQAREQEHAGQGHDGDENAAIKPSLIGLPSVTWRFAILFAGSAPLCNLNPNLLKSTALVDAATLSHGFHFTQHVDHAAVLTKPTLHIHGLSDPGLHLHQRLLNDYCERGSATLIEWDGPHRIPFKSKDVQPVVGAIYDVAERMGVRVIRTVE